MAQETVKTCDACMQAIESQHFSIHIDYKGERKSLDVHENCASFVFSENMLKNYVEKVAPQTKKP